MYDDLSLSSFMSDLKRRTPNETEFHQAVQEVAQSVIPFILDNPKYQHACILQRMAEPGGIVMSESTYQQVRGRFRVHSLGPTMVKGKSNPVRAYSVMSENVA